MSIPFKYPTTKTELAWLGETILNPNWTGKTPATGADPEKIEDKVIIGDRPQLITN